MSGPTVEGWVRCPPGELGQLGQRLRQRRLLKLWLGAPYLFEASQPNKGAHHAASLFLQCPRSQ